MSDRLDLLDLDALPHGTLAEFTQPDGRRLLAVLRYGRLVPLWATNALPPAPATPGTTGRPGTAADAATGHAGPSSGQRTAWGVVPDSSDPARSSADPRSPADGADARPHESGGAEGGTPLGRGVGVGRGAPTLSYYFQDLPCVPSPSADDSADATRGNYFGGRPGVVSLSVGELNGVGSEKFSGGDFPGTGPSAAVDGSGVGSGKNSAADFARASWVMSGLRMGFGCDAPRYGWLERTTGVVLPGRPSLSGYGQTVYVTSAIGPGSRVVVDSVGRVWPEGIVREQLRGQGVG